jgi:hypothetical protein
MDNFIEKQVEMLALSGVGGWKEGGSKLREWRQRHECVVLSCRCLPSLHPYLLLYTIYVFTQSWQGRARSAGIQHDNGTGTACRCCKQ